MSQNPRALTSASPPEWVGSPPKNRPRVAVLDSGVGGLSVVPALARTLPEAELWVVADSAHAPYGERDDAWLQQRCQVLTDLIRGQGVDLMVLACNTATAAAADALRARHGSWPIVGIEPGVKPARALSKTGRIGVMATEATLRSGRFARLLTEHAQGAEVTVQACSGLALAIERGAMADIETLVDQHTRPLREQGVDVVVLGCTHYPFVRDVIQRAVGPDVVLLDTSEAVARRAADLMRSGLSPLSLMRSGTQADTDPAPRAPVGQPAPSGARFWTSGPTADLEAFARRWLGWSIRAEALPGPASARATAAAGPR